MKKESEIEIVFEWDNVPLDMRRAILSWMPSKSIPYTLNKETDKIVKDKFFWIQKLEHFNLDFDANAFLEELTFHDQPRKKIAYLEDMLVDSCDRYRMLFQDIFLSLLTNNLYGFQELLRLYFVDEGQHKNFLLFLSRFEKNGFSFIHLAIKLKRQSFLDFIYYHFLNGDNNPYLYSLFFSTCHGSTYPILWMVLCNQTSVLIKYLYGNSSEKLIRTIDFRELLNPLKIAILYGLKEIVEILVKVLIENNIPLENFLSRMVFNLGTTPYDYIGLAKTLGYQEIVDFLQDMKTRFPGDISIPVEGRISFNETSETFFWETYLRLTLYTSLRFENKEGENQEFINQLGIRLRDSSYYLKYMKDSRPSLYLRCYYDISFLMTDNISKQSEYLVKNFSVGKFKFLIRNFNFSVAYITELMQKTVENDKEKALCIVQSFFSRSDKTKEQKTASFLKKMRHFIAHEFQELKSNMVKQLQTQCYYRCVQNLNESEPLLLAKFSSLIVNLGRSKNISFEELKANIEVALKPCQSKLNPDIQNYFDYFFIWLAKECGVPSEQILASQETRDQTPFRYTLHT